MMAAFAGCGLPGFANFAGEITVFFGAWKSLGTVTVFAAWGALLIGAIYMLRAIRAILHGSLSARWEAVQDAKNPWRKTPFVLLLASLLVFGFCPRLLTDKITPSVEDIIKNNGASETALAQPSSAGFARSERVNRSKDN
jgi:NADH-quinone oxidoreductase subunit M